MLIPELIDIYLLSMDRKDLERISKDSWISFLEGNNPNFPVESLQESAWIYQAPDDKYESRNIHSGYQACRLGNRV